MNAFALAGIALAAMVAIFALVFLFARRVDNHGVVDVAWSLSFALVAGFYALEADGWWARRLLVAGIVGAWSLRLGSHLWIRVASHHPTEDGRYAEMRRKWQPGFARKMFAFFEMQAVSVVLLAVPFLFAASNNAPAFNAVEIAGIAVWLVAWLGESVADAQLARFKRKPENHGRVCDAGLWRFTRHPNYFCEWLIWVGYFLVGCAAPWGWTGIFAPAVILHLLLKVTGVPPTEAQALKSKGDAYRRYQEATSAFFPLPPRTKQGGVH